MKLRHFFVAILALSCVFSFKDPGPKVPKEIRALLTKHTCVTCHDPYRRIIGPPFILVARRNYTSLQITELIANPRPADWPGYPPMTPLPNVPIEDAMKIAEWINTLR